MADSNENETFKETLKEIVEVTGLRLMAPKLVGPISVPFETTDLHGEFSKKNLETDITAVMGLETISAHQFLQIPEHCRLIYVSETLAFYITVLNLAPHTACQITLKTYLESREDTRPMITPFGEVRDRTVSPNELVNDLVMNVIKCSGPHTLHCEVICDAIEHLETRTFKTLRRIVKFDAIYPFEVKNRSFQTDSDDFYVEVQITNLTAGTVVLESVEMVCSSPFKQELFDRFEEGADFDYSMLSPGESSQSLFLLSPKKKMSREKWVEANRNIGRIEILWTTNLGQAGRFNSKQLKRNLKSDERLFLFTFENVPGLAAIGEEFTFQCRIENVSEMPLRLAIELNSKVNSELLWCCVSDRVYSLGVGEVVIVKLSALILQTGIHYITGLTVKDISSERSYNDYNNLVSVAVFQV